MKLLQIEILEEDWDFSNKSDPYDLIYFKS